MGTTTGTSSAAITDDTPNSSVNNEKFLIVETNFKVYAYTSSRVYLALFRHFMRVEYAFANLVVATLTRTSL